MTTSEEFQFTAMEAERLREQVRQLETDLRSKGDECRHYAEKADRLESERDSWRRISERLEAENKRLRERDGNASIELTYGDEKNPFERIELQIVDFGVADNGYVVELPDVLTITKRETTNDSQ